VAIYLKSRLKTSSHAIYCNDYQQENAYDPLMSAWIISRAAQCLSGGITYLVSRFEVTKTLEKLANSQSRRHAIVSVV